jgi:hypothetical protein
VLSADDRLRNIVLEDHCLSPYDGIVTYTDYVCWCVVTLAVCLKDFNGRDVDCSYFQVFLLFIGKGGSYCEPGHKELATYIVEFINWASVFTEKQNSKHFM